MDAVLGAFAIVAAGRRSCSTRKRRLQYCFSTMTAQLIKNGFATATAWDFVAKIRARMISAFEKTATGPGADVFCLNTIIHHLEGA